MHKRILTLLLVHAQLIMAQPTDPFTAYSAGKGTSAWDHAQQVLHLKPDGGNVAASAAISGRFLLTAELESLSGAVRSGWRMIATEDRKRTITASLNAEEVLEWSDGTATSTGKSRKKHQRIIQFESTGDEIILRAAHPGEPLQELWREKSGTSAGWSVSLFAEGDVKSEARWSNIRIDRRIPPGYDPDTSGYPASRLEVMDIQTRRRHIVHQYAHRLEAPNFMPDGKALLFNQDGLLYTVPVAGGSPELLPTGLADRNNNDHGISFDGKWLALSHHRDGMPDFGSTVYIMPLAGGPLRMVTKETPSYWHGWNPNGKEVLYVAKRGTTGVYHIYSNSINGQAEKQLTTHTTGHVDGPEYSPDGKWIYFNGNPTGTMQIWRMRPDGTDRQQITFDENHNWFPHLSPDGRWIAYLSFMPDIHPDEHPAYQPVTLKLLPVAGGAPRILAYLYGGQGTINVPSWSPDSKSLAFVSYTAN